MNRAIICGNSNVTSRKGKGSGISGRRRMISITSCYMRRSLIRTGNIIRSGNRMGRAEGIGRSKLIKRGGRG